MLTVRVDRDSVTMGDAAVSHLITWHLEDDATLAAVVRRTVDGRYLASVGSVGWVLRTDEGRPLVLLRMEWEKPVSVTSFAHFPLDQPLETIVAVRQSHVHLHWSYVLGAPTLSWDEFVAQLG